MSIDIGKVQGHGVAELQAVDELEFGGQAADDLIGAAVPVRAVQHGDRVGLLVVGAAVGDEVGHALGIADDVRIAGRIERTVAGLLGLVGIDRIQRGHAQGGAQRGGVLGVGRDARGLDMGERDLVADRQLVQPVAGSRLVEQGDADVLAQGHTVIIGLVETAADGTLVGKIAAGHAVIDPAVAAGDIDVMLDDGGVLVEDGAHPIGPFPEGIGVVVDGGVARVELALVHHDGILGGVEHGGLAPGILHAVGEVVVDDGLAFGAGLGGHEDHAVGRAGAIDGGGSGVLEDVDALDVAGVDVVDAAGRHPVHDVERGRVVDGADTADDDRGAGARGAGVLGDLDTGGHALEHVVHPVLGLDLQVIGGHRGDGGRHHGLFLDTVADDHGFLEHLGVILEDDLHILCSVVDDYLGDIADAGNLHGGACTGGQGEIAVHTRHGTVLGTLLDHECSDNRLVGMVQYDTLQGDVLRPCCQTQSHCKDQGSNFFHTRLVWLCVGYYG